VIVRVQIFVSAPIVNNAGTVSATIAASVDLVSDARLFGSSVPEVMRCLRRPHRTAEICSSRVVLVGVLVVLPVRVRA
jgi:hypothetical protein